MTLDTCVGGCMIVASAGWNNNNSSVGMLVVKFDQSKRQNCNKPAKRGMWVYRIDADLSHSIVLAPSIKTHHSAAELRVTLADLGFVVDNATVTALITFSPDFKSIILPHYNKTWAMNPIPMECAASGIGMLGKCFSRYLADQSTKQVSSM